MITLYNNGDPGRTDSLGGLFGLYTLFNQPDTFNRYIVGSPSIWWGDRAIMKDAEEFVASEKAPDAKVFMSVGALEERGGEDASFAMVTNMFQLETLLISEIRRAGATHLPGT